MGTSSGVFTAVEWELRVYDLAVYGENWSKAYDSEKSLLFTLTNPHNIGWRRFWLNRAKKHQAIICDSKCRPYFYAVGISADCDVNTHNCTSVGDACTNNPGLDREIVFVGSDNFQVKEIEIIEMRDGTVFPHNSC
jgi:hypothetical protein